MTEDYTRTLDDNSIVLKAALEALEAGDMATFAASFSPNALIWHNFDMIDTSVAQTVDDQLAAKKVFPGMKRFNASYVGIPGGAFYQGTIGLTTADGQTAETPVALRAYIEDERITRIEEYLDPSPAYALMKKMQAG